MFFILFLFLFLLMDVDNLKAKRADRFIFDLAGCSCILTGHRIERVDLAVPQAVGHYEGLYR